MAALLAALVLPAACDDGESSSGATTEPPVTICSPDGTAQAEADLPDVALIAEAIAAVEDEFGAPVEYFEINATARLVNLWVALNDGTMAQPWLYLDGELTSEDAQPGEGGTFVAADIDVDTDSIFDTVRDEIPDAVLETFYIHGDGEGNVRYSVLTSALCGGALDIVLGPDGSVQSVDPL